MISTGTAIIYRGWAWRVVSSFTISSSMPESLLAAGRTTEQPCLIRSNGPRHCCNGQSLNLLYCSCMRAGFFTQFGRVTKVRVSRNKKTGKAKGYGFLEFQVCP